MRLPSLILVAMCCTALSAISAQTLVAEKPAFRQLVPDNALLEKLTNGCKFLEGPAWNTAGGFLVFSDIPADKMYRYDPITGGVTAFREPSRHANGNFYDSAGTLFTCEHGARAVFIEPIDREGGHIASTFEGKRLNSPNDVVVQSDGTVWFTDPTYGLGKAPKEQTTNNVYCLDSKSGEMHPVATDFVQPNGLCFSPDEKQLYIADSGHPPQQVRIFDVTADHHLTGGRVFCQIDQGVPDGMRCDEHGNLFCTAGDGVQIFAPDGTRLGKILVPETPANLCFGGVDYHDLYITARTSLYRIKVTAIGANKPPMK